jgi:predicted nucleic acid-binding protein
MTNKQGNAFSAQDNAHGLNVERMHNHVLEARSDYGLARFRLGLSLLSVKEGDLWQGKAESFWAYVDDLKLNRSACRIYMRVAQKLFIELRLSEEIAAQLALCNMSVLERASEVISPENASDVLSAVFALHQRDALVVLDEIDPSDQPKPRADDVARVFGRFMELPDDRRIEFLHKIGRPRLVVVPSNSPGSK